MRTALCVREVSEFRPAARLFRLLWGVPAFHRAQFVWMHQKAKMLKRV
jgi:hypothetical protein